MLLVRFTSFFSWRTVVGFQEGAVQPGAHLLPKPLSSTPVPHFCLLCFSVSAACHKLESSAPEAVSLTSSCLLPGVRKAMVCESSHTFPLSPTPHPMRATGDLMPWLCSTWTLKTLTTGAVIAFSVVFLNSSHLKQATWRPPAGGATLGVQYTWSSTVEKGC